MSLHSLFFCFSHGKKTVSATGKYNQWTVVENICIIEDYVFCEKEKA